VRAEGRAGSRCGGTALRRRPAPCVPNAKAAGRAAAHQRRDSPPAPAAYGGNPAWPALPAGDPCAYAPEPGRARMARPAEAP
jgi:hypothetical protein